MDARHPKSCLPDFGMKIAEIGSSRFRLLAAILRDARKSALLRMRSIRVVNETRAMRSGDK